jgi:hypothetical protein
MSGDYRESLEFLKLLKQRGVTLVIEDALSLMYFKEQFLEFKKWLREAGVALSVYSLSALENSGVQLNRLSNDTSSLLGQACEELPPPNDENQSLILLYTDFLSPHWEDGHYDEILRKWVEKGNFLTLISALPDWMLGRTRLGRCERVYLETNGPSHPLSSWQVKPKYPSQEGVPNQSHDTIIPMLATLDAKALDHLRSVLSDDPQDNPRKIFSICLPRPEQTGGLVVSEQIRDERQVKVRVPANNDSRTLDPLSVQRFCQVASPKARVLLEELLIDNPSRISYGAIQKMQKELFGEIDPMVGHETILSAFWVDGVLLPNGERAKWGKTVNLDTDLNTLAFNVFKRDEILKQFNKQNNPLQIYLNGSYDCFRPYYQRRLARAMESGFETPTVLYIEQGRFMDEDIQIAQLPDFVLEVLSEKGPEFLQQCRNDTTNRRGGGRGYGTIPVFPNLSIQTPPIDNDDLFWSSVGKQISDFNKRTFWKSLNEGWPQDVFTAWRKHMNGGEMG